MSVGGGDFVNLVPQDPQLNRGWSETCKRWRSLERAVAADPGAFAQLGDMIRGRPSLYPTSSVTARAIFDPAIPV